MIVEMVKPFDVTALYLEHLKSYPGIRHFTFIPQQFYVNFFGPISVEACQPQVDGEKATFTLSLRDIFQCMVTKVVNKASVSSNRNFCLWDSRNLASFQGRQVYYHRIITEYQSRPKQVFLVKCDTYQNQTKEVVKRSARPQFPSFREVE